MTTLYRPVLIESAEQAEALPVGTIALLDPDKPAAFENHAAVRVDHYEADGFPWLVDSQCLAEHPSMVGWTALVPIEAEEEFTAMGTDDGEHWIAHVGRDGIDGSRKEAELYVERFGGFIAHRNRTPWEETP